jgi:hypothetical protein
LFNFLKNENKDYNYIKNSKAMIIMINFLDINDLYQEYNEFYSFFEMIIDNFKENENLFNKCLLLYKKEGEKM